MALTTLDHYGASQRTDGTAGHGGIVTTIIDDSFSDTLPFPFQSNIIKEIKTGPGAVVQFYMPSPGNLPSGAIVSMMYSNGARPLEFLKAPGETGDILINGSIAPLQFDATDKREFFIISCDSDEWRIEKLVVPRSDEVPAFFSSQPYVTIGNSPLTFEFPIPANVIDRTSGQDILYIRAMLQHENGGGGDETTIAWRQPVGAGPMNVLFAGQCGGTPAASWLEIQASAKGVGGADTQFFAVEHCAQGDVTVAQVETSALDLTQDWELVVFTDNVAILTTVFTMSYEASRAV
jgi:hypothetical protein